MCHECVIIKKNGEKFYADCCQQLADNLGCAVADLPMDEPRDHGLDPNECLCWIDFAKIAADREMVWRGPSYAADDPHWDDHVLTEIGASGEEEI